MIGLQTGWVAWTIAAGVLFLLAAAVFIGVARLVEWISKRRRPQ